MVLKRASVCYLKAFSAVTDPTDLYHKGNRGQVKSKSKDWLVLLEEVTNRPSGGFIYLDSSLLQSVYNSTSGRWCVP